MLREHLDIPAVFVDHDIVAEIQAQLSTQPAGFVAKRIKCPGLNLGRNPRAIVLDF